MATAVKSPVKKRFPSAVKNILSILSFASAAEIADGKKWYQEANAFANEMAANYGVSVEIVAGIISSLSPGTDWERNKAETIVVLNGNKSHKFGTYGPNVRKAFEISIAGLHVDIATFFPANKTFNFYHNIINPADTNFVTIDRHCLTIANGSVRADKSITNAEYKEIANAFFAVAKKTGFKPLDLQAIVWVALRNAKGYKKVYKIADFVASRQTVN